MNGSAATVAILLAAGRSARFGAEDKLKAFFLGRPLAHHAAATLAGIGLARCIAIVSETANLGLEEFGFETIEIKAGAPLSSSLKAGIAAAEGQNALIALADMPLVPGKHFRRLLEVHTGGATASDWNGQAMVPAVIDGTLSEDVLALDGDRGAQSLLKAAKLVEAWPEWLVDIDTPEQLAAAEMAHKTATALNAPSPQYGDATAIIPASAREFWKG